MKIKILIVDDEPDISQVLSDTLVSEGYETLCAQTPLEFRSKALLDKPDLVILDIDLGSENGPDVYADLLQMGFDPRIPVIFLSGLVPENLCQNSLGTGHHYAMHAKPFDLEKLIRDIRILTRSLQSGAA